MPSKIDQWGMNKDDISNLGNNFNVKLFYEYIQGGRKKGCFKVLEKKLLTKNNNKNDF
jgi:hypothetical protein